MVKMLNFLIPVLILLAPFVLFLLIRAIVNKSQIIYLVIMLLFSLITVGVFYFPLYLKFDDNIQLSVSVDRDSWIYKSEDTKQTEKIKKLIEKHRFIRDISKTLDGVPPTPAEQAINTFVSGINIPYNSYIFIRKDSDKFSFIEVGSQFYTAVDKEGFHKDMLEFTSKENLGNFTIIQP